MLIFNTGLQVYDHPISHIQFKFVYQENEPEANLY